MLSNKEQNTILSVDDSPDKLELIAVILKEAGYRVLSASSGREGLEIAKEQIPDLIISDVTMPGMDGFEFCRLIRADEKLRSIPIMLNTAIRKDTESLARGLEAGADDYLEAPFDPGALSAKVARLIERKRTDEPLAILASIVADSEEAIIGTLLDGTITSWNFGAERIYGYQAEEVLGQPLFDLIVPVEQREQMEGILNGIGRGVRVNRFVTQRIRKDGNVIDVSLSVAPIKDAHGRVTGASSIGRDITESLLAEQEKRRLIEELQDALAEVKTLRGILPICMHCKKIRDEEGAWKQLELYIRDHTHAEFSHGICGPCTEKMYPEIYEKMQRRKA